LTDQILNKCAEIEIGCIGTLFNLIQIL